MCLMLHIVQRIGQSQPLLLPTLRFMLLLLAVVCNNLHLIAYLLCHQFSLVGSLMLTVCFFSRCTNSFQFLINYYLYYYNYFTALHPGLPGWAGTRRNIHPLTYPDRRPDFISFFHLPWSIASSLFNLRAWQSFCTTSVQVLFGLPVGLEPSTSYSIHFFNQSVSFSQHIPIPSQPALL